MTVPQVHVEVVVPSGADRAAKYALAGYYVVLIGVVLLASFPQLRYEAWRQLDRVTYPIRYRYWYMALPTWHREGLIVRGRGIPGTA